MTAAKQHVPVASSGRLWAMLTTGFGLLAVATTIAFQLLPEVRAGGPCLTPDFILSFEFANAPADLDALFGGPDDPCRPLRIAAMDATNRLDLALYIPGYTLFLAAAALWLAGPDRAGWRIAGIGLALVAFTADMVETTHLLAFTPELSPSQEMLTTSSLAAWIKFWALGLQPLILGWACWTTPGVRRPRLAVALALPVVGVGLTSIQSSLGAALMATFAIAWIALIGVALRESLARRN